MAAMRISRFVTLAPALLLVVSACSKPGNSSSVPAQLGANALEELAEVYKFIRAEKQPLPRQLSDLDTYRDSLPTAYDQLQRGQIVVAWGVGLGATSDAGATVLAYDKDAATAGGLVLLQSGSVKSVTAAEFKTLRKAAK